MCHWKSSGPMGIAIAAVVVFAFGGTESLHAQAVTVQLGQHGGQVTLIETESGQFTWNGSPVFHGFTLTAANGNDYVLTMVDGTWRAEYLTRFIRIALGTTGSAITIEQREDGRYWWWGLVESGLTVTDADGAVYRLTLVGDSWNAVFVPELISIRLGQSGEAVQIARQQDGSFLYNGERVQAGLQVMDSSGRAYEFVLRDGAWQVTTIATPPPTPPGRPAPSPVLVSDNLETHVGVQPVLKPGPDGTRRSLLAVAGVEYSVQDLFANGSVDNSLTFVELAAGKIIATRSRIEALTQLAGIDLDSLRTSLESDWEDARVALEPLFGRDGARDIIGNIPTRRTGSLDTDAMIETLAEIVDALSSYENFFHAVQGGVFQSAINSDRIEEAYDATQNVSKLEFGTTSNTRFGAYLNYERGGIGSIDNDLVLRHGEAGLGAFAYSPLEATRRVELPNRGGAEYLGGTVAVAPDGSFETYTGIIELLVHLSSSRVSGLIRDLRNEEGDLWRYAFGEVEYITLPSASLASDASFSVIAGTGNVSYGTTLGGRRPRTVNGGFKGQILGTGSQAGEAMIGTWNISENSGLDILISGAFGAEHQSTSSVVRPVVDDSGEVAQTFIGTRPDSEGLMQLGGQDGAGNEIQFAVASLFANGVADSIGDPLVSLAKGQIERQIRLLDLWLSIDGSNTETNRRNVWRSANETIYTIVFGSDRRARNPLGASYPAGTRRDSTARSTLVAAAEALSSVSRFEDAIAAGGVFEDVADAVTNTADMFAVREHHVRVEYRHTDYGRFGVWAKTVATSATRGQSLAATDRLDVFAYSPLAQSVYSVADPTYPAGGTAYYEGRTLAVEESASPRFYDGAIELTVEWGSRPSAGLLSASITELRNIDSGALVRYNNAAISEITYSGIRLSGGSGSATRFSSGSPSTRIVYADQVRSATRWNGSRSFAGQFVGNTSDGPVGVIGTWSLGPSTNLAALNGAYAGDLVP